MCGGGGGGLHGVIPTPTTPYAASAQTSEASAQCWSKSDCMKKTLDCQACFELKADVCGENRGFCYAKPVPATLEISLGGLREVTDPAQYISALYQWGVSITGILAGIMIMIGGLLYLTAGGSPERVSNAKDYISSALIGLILALTSYFLLQTVNPALLTLKFPKVPLVAPAVQFTQFCEDLEEAGIEVEPEGIGKTLCGDPGIPKPTDENANVPSKCTYGKCADVEQSCIPCTSPDPLDCTKTATCQSCARVRLDPALAAIKDPSTGSDFQTPRRNYGFLTCDKFEPIAQYPHINKCEFLDTLTALGSGGVWESFKSACGDFGSAAVWASLGTGALRSGVAKFTKLGTEFTMEGGVEAAEVAAEVAGFATKVSRAEVYTSKLAAGADVAASGTGTVGGLVGSETLTNISNVASFAASCGGGTLVALANPAAATIGGVYVALKEFFKTGEIARHPENFFGTQGTCALVKINCDEINSCEDYARKIKFKAAGETSWQETLSEMALSPEAFLSSAQNVRAYCDLNPCHLPLDCVSAIQNSWYWNPDGRTGTVASPTSASASGTSVDDYKCIPRQMAAINSSFGTGRWLLNQEGINSDMIYPIVYPFIAGAQQKGQLCVSNADCASGSCSGAGATYVDVKEATARERNPFQITKNQEKATIGYKRCR